MFKPWEVVTKLEATNSRLDKEAIISEEILQFDSGESLYIQEASDFFNGCSLALDKLYTFGVKQVPVKKEDKGAGLEYKQFLVLAEELNTRKATGNYAKELIEEYMNKATKEQWNNWYRRILIKDLRCGVSEKTINSVCKKAGTPQYSVPVFTCQLSHDSANHEKKVVGKKQIEVKLDGVRVLTIVRVNGTVEQFSRNGKQFHNFQHICDEIATVTAKGQNPWGVDVVLDGEVMSNNFQDLMKQIHRKSQVTAQDAVLHLFDIIPLEEFLNGEWNKPQHERSEMIQSWCNANNLKHVEALSWENVDLSTTKGKDRFSEINKQAVAGGYEGIMIKDIDAPYQCKRSHAWLKMKPFIEVTLKVVNIEEGTGRNAGRVGALICHGVDDGKEIEVNVGSGLTDAMRDDIWVMSETGGLSSLIGDLVEVRADAITKNQDSETYSLRFPRFKGFRSWSENPEEKL